MSRRKPRHAADLNSGTPDVTCRRALILFAEVGPRTPRPCRGAVAESPDLPLESTARAGNPGLARAENPDALPENARPGRHSLLARQSTSSTPASRPDSR